MPLGTVPRPSCPLPGVAAGGRGRRRPRSSPPAGMVEAVGARGREMNAAAAAAAAPSKRRRTRERHQQQEEQGVLKEGTGAAAEAAPSPSESAPPPTAAAPAPPPPPAVAAPDPLLARLLEVAEQQGRLLGEQGRRLEQMGARQEQMGARLEQMGARLEQLAEQLGQARGEVRAVRAVAVATYNACVPFDLTGLPAELLSAVFCCLPSFAHVARLAGLCSAFRDAARAARPAFLRPRARPDGEVRDVRRTPPRRAPSSCPRGTEKERREGGVAD